MENEKRLLTFEWDPEGKALKINGNRKGLEELLDSISWLLKRGEQDHVHMMTPEWGGNGLTSEKQDPDALLINHVKIINWED
jgi:hypothetical protein